MKKKNKQELVRINTTSADHVSVKPPRDKRPKCLQCDKTILMRRSWWYNTDLPANERPPVYYYDGISYFCSRNCCMAYAHKKAEEELNIPKFNNV